MALGAACPISPQIAKGCSAGATPGVLYGQQVTSLWRSSQSQGPARHVQGWRGLCQDENSACSRHGPRGVCPKGRARRYARLIRATLGWLGAVASTGACARPPKSSGVGELALPHVRTPLAPDLGLQQPVRLLPLARPVWGTEPHYATTPAACSLGLDFLPSNQYRRRSRLAADALGQA